MNEINFNIEDIEKIDLSMDVGIKEIYPPLENLTVEPTKEQQVFNHENSYGYDNITVQPIPDEYIIPEGMLPITENATYDVRKFARVSTSVHPAPNLQDKSITINENGTHSITADEEYDGLNQVDVTVEVEGKEDLTEELTTQDEKITTQETTINDIVEALQGKASGGGSAKLQEKNITITQNGTQNIVPDAGYNGLSSVKIVTSVTGGGSSTEIYSTAETMTNATWIDGKPIYRIVAQITLPTSIKEGTYSSSSADLTSLNIDTPVNVSGLVKRSSVAEYWNINTYNNTLSANDSIWCCLGNGGKSVYVSTNASAYASASVNIIVEYTKAE